MGAGDDEIAYPRHDWGAVEMPIGAAHPPTQKGKSSAVRAGRGAL